ncbi:MAG: phosphopyruvate hydratase [Thermoprotei archaeon]|jgi:enolase
MPKYAIEDVKARWILDSRANPTIEARVKIEEGIVAVAAVPSGASKGEFEALELRDGGSAFHGMGVKKAIDNVNSIIGPKIKGMDVREQKGIDEAMIALDGTPNKSKLGANAILSVSLAVARAAALAQGVELHEWISKLYGRKPLLPVPFSNVLNGGEHAGNDLSIQEFMIVPVGLNTFHEALQAVSEIYVSLRSYVTKKYGAVAKNVGDEGGVAPPMGTTQEALSALENSIIDAGYSSGKEVRLALDAASSTFFNNGKYRIDGKLLTKDELMEYWKKIIGEYKVISIEDPFEQNDFESTAKFTKQVKQVQVVGDDIFVTQIARLKRGIEVGACNALLLKVNQVGTVSEAVDAGLLAMRSGYSVMVSHRSGETTDDFIADLAVGLGTGQIKTGAPARGERVAKYNRLLKIEEDTGISYAGLSIAHKI